MTGFIKWHKLMIGKAQSFLRINNYESLWLSWLKGLIMGIIIMSLFSGCYIYDGQKVVNLLEKNGAYYSDPNYDDVSAYQNETIHYHNNNVYHGYYQGFYYYYGQPHWYPWTYYYTIMPHYTYSISTHIHVHVQSGYAVNRPRGTKFNNRTVGTYTPINTSSVINKRPIRNNRVYVKPNINHNTRPNNNKVNTNKVNTNRNNKVNINRNNKSNRNNKVNINRNKNVNTNKRSNRNKPR